MSFTKDTIYGVLAVIGGILIHFTYGHFYTIGNLAPYMMSYIKLRVDSDIELGSSVWISAIALAMQGVSMPLGGAVLPKIGYRAVVIIGSIVNSGGVLLTYFTIQKGFIYVVLTYAVILGFGFGFSYAVIFAVAASWFPARRGLIVGFIVGGFGLGALVFTPIQTMYINPNNVPVNNQTKLFDDPELLDRVPTAFLMLGGSLAALQCIGILLLRQKPTSEEQRLTKLKGDEPPTKAELKPLSGDAVINQNINNSEPSKTVEDATYTGSMHSLAQSVTNITAIAEPRPPAPAVSPVVGAPPEINLSPMQVLRRHEFYLLWFTMLCHIIPITLITASFKLVGQNHIPDDRFLSGVATASSLFNSGGRIMWGAICDRISFKFPLCTMLTLWSIVLFTFPHIVAVKTGGMVIYAIWVCLLFLLLSGVFVLMPAATGRIFGPVYMAVNYGMVFTAFAVGSIMCAVISEKLKGQWGLLYAICGSICLCALFLSLWVQDPFIPKKLNFFSPCSRVAQHIQPMPNPTKDGQSNAAAAK